MLPFLVFSVVVILADIYAYKGLKILAAGITNPFVKPFLKIIFWLIPLLLISVVFYVSYIRQADTDPRIFNSYYYIIGFAFLIYLPKLVFILFHLLEDIIHAIIALSGKFTYWAGKHQSRISAKRAKRWTLLSKTGIVIALIPFLAIIYGMVIGRFDFRVTNISIRHESVPEAFDGFRIIHISDLHIGSFYGYEKQIKKAVELIKKEKPDLIVFTGDLVNNFSSEAAGFIDVLSEMSAPYGMFSILGNHDYGDYYQWATPYRKQENMELMYDIHNRIGFRLLLNESDSVEAGGQKIAVVGVENWGVPPFPQYGDLDKASAGTEDFPFRILLTHDPSHWDAEVLGKTDIEITLAGHTHGMQVGLEVGNIKWSPGKLKYPRWGGLYEENGQYLYVNRGLGFIAFPGRIGMPPEITVIELRTL